MRTAPSTGRGAVARSWVWRVEDAARALFEVDDFVRFVIIQTEFALCHITSSVRYDGAGRSLRENTDQIATMLSAEIAGRRRGMAVTRPADVDTAHALPAGTVDLLGAGPVFTSATKPDAGDGIGLDGLAELVTRTAGTWPVVAIGGITPATAASVLRTGVDGVAVSSALTHAADPAATARALRPAVAFCGRRPDDRGHTDDARRSR